MCFARQQEWRGEVWAINSKQFAPSDTVVREGIGWRWKGEKTWLKYSKVCIWKVNEVISVHPGLCLARLKVGQKTLEGIMGLLDREGHLGVLNCWSTHSLNALPMSWYRHWNSNIFRVQVFLVINSFFRWVHSYRMPWQRAAFQKRVLCFWVLLTSCPYVLRHWSFLITLKISQVF